MREHLQVLLAGVDDVCDLPIPQRPYLRVVIKVDLVAHIDKRNNVFSLNINSLRNWLDASPIYLTRFLIFVNFILNGKARGGGLEALPQIVEVYIGVVREAPVDLLVYGVLDVINNPLWHDVAHEGLRHPQVILDIFVLRKDLKWLFDPVLRLLLNLLLDPMELLLRLMGDIRASRDTVEQTLLKAVS